MSCNTNGKVDIFSLDSYELVAQFDPHPDLSSHATDPIGGVAWSSTGSLATGGASVFEKEMEKTDSTIKLRKIDEVPAGSLPLFSLFVVHLAHQQMAP
jgi:WD40 repeat protein